MRKTYTIILFIITLFIISGCEQKENKNQIIFATSADYPPFEYYQNNQIIGFDIDIAQIIGKKLNKKVIFENIPFNTILPSIQTKHVDAAIGTITITKERLNNFDFSDSYYKESIAIMYEKNNAIKNTDELKNKKIACQIGTTMEIWLKSQAINAIIYAMDSSLQVIESLKSQNVDYAIIDSAQAASFAIQNKNLSYTVIEESGIGYGIAFKKGSKLKQKINDIIKQMKEDGTIEKLEKKWFYSNK